MDDASLKPRPPAELAAPHVRLAGPMDNDLLRTFLDAMAAAEDAEGPLVVEATTNGGDADIGRRMAVDVRLFRERTGRRTIFLGKAVVYSAGTTLMAAFPRDDRWLARETTLLIHCRSLARSLELSGPLATERPKVEALLAEIDLGLDVEEEDFGRLIEGRDVRLEELLERAHAGWYLRADEALARGIVAGVI